MRIMIWATLTVLCFAISRPADAAFLIFNRSVLTNMTEAACFKSTAESGRKVFTNFKTSPLDAAGTLPDRKYAGVFVSVTCVGQGQNTVLMIMAAGDKADAAKAAVDHVKTLMILGFGPLPAG